MSDWDGNERRGSFNVRAAIMKAVDAENDPKVRNGYMLMLGIIEAMESGFQSLAKKMDNLLHDEQTIKRVVLNGHDGNHHKHHDWIEQRIAADKYYTDLIARAMPALEWVENHKKESEQIKPICDWARAKREEEEIAKQDKKSLFMKFLEGIVSHVGTAVGVGLIAYFTFK